MFLVDKRKAEIFSLPAKEIKAEDAKAISSGLAIKIIKSLASSPKYPIELAKELKVHEQKVYYHIRNLEKAGVIKVSRQEGRQGAVAKYYALESPALAVRFKEFEAAQRLVQVRNNSEFLEPFIKDGQLNAIIIVGSPDPHGPEKARSRDGYYGMDLALFIGTFLNYVPNFYVKLDTEAREEDLKNNLILIGGPIVNRITDLVNPKLAVRFDKDNHWAIKSTLTNNIYPTDETGLIVKAKNPFDSDKQVLIVAGKRYSGTRAAIIGFLKYFKEITAGNVHNPAIKAKVVEGIDLDSDGIIDDVEIRE